jgi:hypothetical protein
MNNSVTIQIARKISGSFFNITAFPAENMSSQSSDGKENFRKDETLNCQGYIFSTFL